GGGGGGVGEVRLGQEVRVDVVVGERAVLVGPGDAVDAEPPLRVVMAERAPQARRLDEELDPDVALELLVAGSSLVARDGVCDVGVDVEGGGAGRPVPGALLAADRAPGEGCAAEAERAGTLAGEVE